MVTTVHELSSLAMFEGCAPDELERVTGALAGVRDVSEGTVICREGERADRWWIVLEGTADVTVRGLYVATIGPGETIGELALLDGEPRNATVTATTDMTVEEVDGEGFVEALIDSPRLALEAAKRDVFDVVTDYALLLPAQIISEMLGMPHADIPQLRKWSHAMTKTLDPLSTPEEEAAAVDATRAMVDYVERIIADKRAHPADDILTALIEAEETGDRLSTDELLAQVILLYIAGHETTLNLIGNGLTHLFEFPDQLDRLRTDPSLDANAIEELLRFDSPVQFARRIALEPLEIEGVTIPAGSVISLALAAANRDPRKWGPTADIVDLTRAGANEHVSFGGGAHYCLGAALARLEGQIALPQLVRRFPHIGPAYDEPAWGQRMVLLGVDRLPVTFRPV